MVSYAGAPFVTFDSVRPTYPMRVLQELQVGNLVAPQPVDNVVLRQELGNLRRRLLVLLQLRQDLLSLLGVLGRGVGDAVEVAVQRRHVIGHVGVLQQLDLAREDLLRLFVFALLLRLVALELDQGKQQVPAQVLCHLGHDRRAIGRDGLENILHGERRFGRGDFVSSSGVGAKEEDAFVERFAGVLSLVAKLEKSQRSKQRS